MCYTSDHDSLNKAPVFQMIEGFKRGILYQCASGYRLCWLAVYSIHYCSTTESTAIILYSKNRIHICIREIVKSSFERLVMCRQTKQRNR